MTIPEAPIQNVHSKQICNKFAYSFWLRLDTSLKHDNESFPQIDFMTGKRIIDIQVILYFSG